MGVCNETLFWLNGYLSPVGINQQASLLNLFKAYSASEIGVSVSNIPILFQEFSSQPDIQVHVTLFLSNPNWSIHGLIFKIPSIFFICVFIFILFLIFKISSSFIYLFIYFLSDLNVFIYIYIFIYLFICQLEITVWLRS